jgi:hypothetical protein
MKEYEFYYWLMGMFEISKIEELSTKQVYLLKEHLKLVIERKHVFCTWLDGFLESHEENELNKSKTQKILHKLQEEFLNNIDKSYPENLVSQLNAAHQGRETPIVKKENKGGFEAMC